MKVHVVVVRAGSEMEGVVVHRNLDEAYNHYQKALEVFRHRNVYLHSVTLEEPLGDDADLQLFDVLVSLDVQETKATAAVGKSEHGRDGDEQESRPLAPALQPSVAVLA